MEHASILPASASPAPFAAIPLPVEVQSALALHGLRELIHAPVAVLAFTLAHLDREQLGQAIEVMIAMLDLIDGDPDCQQANGDELDGTAAEDDFFPHGNWLNHPGCPISDPGGQCDEDETNTGDGKFYLHGTLYAGAGCPIGDGGEDDGRHDVPTHQQEGR